MYEIKRIKSQKIVIKSGSKRRSTDLEEIVFASYTNLCNRKIVEVEEFLHKGLRKTRRN